MEEENKQQGSNKKKSNPLSSLFSVGGKGGGGIAGLVVFGGALAFAGYLVVASFARKNKNKAKKGGRGTHDQQPTNRPKSQEILLDECECGCKDQEDHALHSLLQHSKSQDVDAAWLRAFTCVCCSSRWTSDNNNKGTNQVSPSDLLSAKTLILEEKNDPKPNSEEESIHHQEIAFSDHSHPESAASSNENWVAEDHVASSLFNSPNGQAQEIDLYEPQDGLKSIETESEDSDIIDDNDDGILGSGEEDSSKATGCTSLNYNKEPVWPAELMVQEPEPEPEFKGGYCENNHVCSDCDADGSDYAENDKAMKATNKATLNKKANFSLLLRDQSSVLRTMVIPTLLLALLLVLVLLNRQGSLYVLDEGSSVIVP